MNAPDPQAQDLAAIFNGFGAVRLNFGAKPASKLVPSASIPLPAGLQKSKIADTVCKNSILETVDSWDGFQKPLHGIDQVIAVHHAVNEFDRG